MRRRPPEGNRILAEERRDPIAFLRRRAEEHASYLRLRPSWIDEGTSLVVETLGEEWLRAACDEHGPFMHRLDHGHSVANAFRTGDAGSILRILELGLYVKHLRACPGFASIPDQLRGDFESTRLQLAHAYRVQRQGPRVCLEPEAAAGRKGDIAFRWSGREYLVECYARARKRDPLTEFFSYGPKRILGEENCRTRTLRILVWFHRAPTDGERLTINRRLREIVSRVQGDQAERDELEVASLEVQDISTRPEEDFTPDGIPDDDGPYGDAHAVLTAAEVPLSLARQVPGPGLLARNGTRMLIWRPPGPAPRLTERVSELADRIERKLVQTRAVTGGVRRVVIAQLEPGREGDVHHQGLMRGLASRILAGHAQIAAFVVCAREIGPIRRFRYIGTVFPGSVPDDLPAAIRRWSAETDHLRDPFLDWNR